MLDHVKNFFLGERYSDITPAKVSKFPPAPEQVQVYYAGEPRVVDGDTCFMTVIGWGGHNVELKLRLAGIDSPEKRTIEGKQAESYTKVWCAAVATSFDNSHLAPYPFTVIITGPDKYQPRWNAIVYNTVTGECLNQTLLDQGLAEEYPKKKVKISD
jgi:endonuclease YncB( thermonuclease family)